MQMLYFFKMLVATYTISTLTLLTAYTNANPQPMDAYPSVTAATPESSVPVAFPSEPMSPGAAIDPVAPLANAEETLTAEFMGADENARDAAQDNQRKRLPFGARGRSRFRGCGMRLAAGVRGKFHHYPFLVATGKSTIVESYEQQLVAPEVVTKINLSTTTEEVPLEAPASKASLPPQTSLLPPTWCNICRVDCNSLTVLEKHRTGKRHKRTVQLMEKLEGRPEMVEELLAKDRMKPEQHSESVAVPIDNMREKGPLETSNIKCGTSANPKKKRKRNAAPEQTRVCILCNAACNSQAMFESHLAGKKHTSRVKHFQRPNTIYGLMSGYTPSNQSSTLASQDALPLYYGLMKCEQPQSKQAYEFKEHLPLLDSEGQYGFIES